MNDDQQRQEAERRRRFGVPNGVDPRRMMDAAAVEKLMKAQAVARAEAQAATTIVIATVVSLVTSAFSFIAALAWNDAIQSLLSGLTAGGKIGGFTLNPTEIKVVYALIVTLIAIVVTLLVNRFAGNFAKKSAIAAASAGS